MKKEFISNQNDIKTSFSHFNQSKTLKKISNNVLFNQSAIQQKYETRNNTNVTNMKHFNTITTDDNKSYNKYRSSLISNYSQFMNISQKNNKTIDDNITNNNNNITNTLYNSTSLNQAFNINDSLISMELNFKLLKQKISNLNNIVSPSTNINTHRSKHKLSRKFPTCKFIQFNEQKDIDKNNYSNDILNKFNDKINDKNNDKNNKTLNYINQKNIIKRKILDNNQNSIKLNKNTNSTKKLNDNIFLTIIL
jgi:hypothetical protein